MIKCKNCDFETKSEYTIEVHVAKCRTENFECGLCEETFVKGVDLEIHLRTCETYECSNCWKRMKNLGDIKNHIETQHANYTNLVMKLKQLNLVTDHYPSNYLLCLKTM